MVDRNPGVMDVEMLIMVRTDGRYFMIGRPRADLLGDLMVPTWRGSLNSNHRAAKAYYVRDTADAARCVVRLCRLRERHGYQAPYVDGAEAGTP